MRLIRNTLIGGALIGAAAAPAFAQETYGGEAAGGSDRGPAVTVGAIFSVYVADVLKQWLNHDRPPGSPLVHDPTLMKTKPSLCLDQATQKPSFLQR